MVGMESYFDVLFALYLFDCLHALDNLLYGSENWSNNFIVLNICYLSYTAVILFLYALMLCYSSSKKIKFKCSKNEIYKLLCYFGRYEFDSATKTIRDERLPCGVCENDTLCCGCYI